MDEAVWGWNVRPRHTVFSKRRSAYNCLVKKKSGLTGSDNKNAMKFFRLVIRVTWSCCSRRYRKGKKKVSRKPLQSHAHCGLSCLKRGTVWCSSLFARLITSKKKTKLTSETLEDFGRKHVNHSLYYGREKGSISSLEY